MRIALVNTNRITPPVAPIGLDYVAETLRASGHRPELLDLCWEERWEPAIARFLANGQFGRVERRVRGGRRRPRGAWAGNGRLSRDIPAADRCVKPFTRRCTR